MDCQTTTNMNSKKSEPEEYNKYFLSKRTVNQNLIKHIEALASDDNVPKFAFHKILVNNWTASLEILFDVFSDYFTTLFIPVNPSVQDEIASFYTNNLNLLLKIIMLDFTFLYGRIIVHVDIIYNDKTSVDFFDKYETISDIVSGIVSSRFQDYCELDLSDFCNDAGFLKKKIYFYKLGLLSNFKILMMRFLKETKSLNLSNNNLGEPPSVILNFCIKGSLTSINLSNNNIKTLNQVFTNDLHTCQNKLEKLWLEGNPLCDHLEPWEYVKSIAIKFPKLVSLDGVPLNPKEAMMPFIKNFLVVPDLFTKTIVEKFLSQYFRAYDEPKRRRIGGFYNKEAKLSLSLNVTGVLGRYVPYFGKMSRNILDPVKGKRKTFEKLLIKGRLGIVTALFQIPRYVHDRSSMTVDVLQHDQQCLVLVVDATCKATNTSVFLRTRRTFVLFKDRKIKEQCVTFTIMHELFHATMLVNGGNFKRPPANEDPIVPHEPNEDERAALLRIFANITRLKLLEADQRLWQSNWDIRKALMQVTLDIDHHKLLPNDFVDDDDETDASNRRSILDMID